MRPYDNGAPLGLGKLPHMAPSLVELCQNSAGVLGERLAEHCGRNASGAAIVERNTENVLEVVQASRSHRLRDVKLGRGADDRALSRQRVDQY